MSTICRKVLISFSEYSIVRPKKVSDSMLTSKKVRAYIMHVYSYFMVAHDVSVSEMESTAGS